MDNRFLSATSKKKASLLKSELLSFKFVLQNYSVFLLKTQNFIFKPVVFSLQTSISLSKFILHNSIFAAVN